MSEVRLVVREAECDWSGIIHGSCADRAVAALSADPATFEELEVAVTRFAKVHPGRRYLSNLQRGLCDELYDAGLVVIDLTARMVVADSTCSSFGEGVVAYHNGECCTAHELRYHLAEDWHFSTDGMNWRCMAESRRRERSAIPRRDNRAVFYGRPLLEFLARETFGAFGQRDKIAAASRLARREELRERLARRADVSPDQIADAQISEEEAAWSKHEVSPFRDAIKQIHADWLLTPRQDLGGACPRDVALERHGHLSWDNQDRCEQWSILDECARGLDKSSDAYRYGGFGTHELVKHYDLVRELLWSCWDGLTELSQSGCCRLELLTVGDFLSTEIPRLEGIRDGWLDAPDVEFHGRTPRSIIEKERARIPEAVSGHEAMADPDCPCCQMMSEMSGPFFWHLDGSGMDDDFAFAIHHRTRIEWEEEQRQWAELSRRMDAESAECRRLGVESKSGEEGSSSLWSRSLSVNDADVPLGIRIFGIGGDAAKLIVALRAGAARESVSPETQSFIDGLNRDFGNLRDVLLHSELSLAAALIQPVLDRFAATLDDIVTSRPQLERQCDTLSDNLRNLLEPPAPLPDWTVGDLGVPF